MAALIATFVRILWIRIPVCILCFGWSVWGEHHSTTSVVTKLISKTHAAAVNFLGGTRLEDSRAFLGVYPAILLYFLLAWITMLS